MGGPAWHLLMQAQPLAYSWPQLLSEAAQDTSFLSCEEPGLSLCCSGAGSIGQALPMPLLCTQVTHRPSHRKPNHGMSATSWQVDSQRKGGPTGGKDKAWPRQCQWGSLGKKDSKKASSLGWAGELSPGSIHIQVRQQHAQE